MKRKILVEVEIDWEDYEDVSDELIIEDALTSKFEGVEIRVVETDIASKIYDVLVQIGGATEDNRESFIHYYHTDGSEWRFSGLLGFGGKYRKRTNSVDCYAEDETQERTSIIDEINQYLTLIFKNTPVHKLYNRNEVFKLTHDSLNLGMDLRQKQLNGDGSKSGNEVHQEWFDKNVKEIYV